MAEAVGIPEVANLAVGLEGRWLGGADVVGGHPDREEHVSIKRHGSPCDTAGEASPMAAPPS